jgi:hypothetical protein
MGNKLIISRYILLTNAMIQIKCLDADANDLFFRTIDDVIPDLEEIEMRNYY